jgi:hypothetical protein
MQNSSYAQKDARALDRDARRYIIPHFADNAQLAKFRHVLRAVLDLKQRQLQEAYSSWNRSCTLCATHHPLFCGCPSPTDC